MRITYFFANLLFFKDALIVCIFNTIISYANLPLRKHSYGVYCHMFVYLLKYMQSPPKKAVGLMGFFTLKPYQEPTDAHKNLLHIKTCS